MKLHYLVYTPQGKVGVSDDSAGDRRFEQIYSQYGDCKVEVRTDEQVFGHGLEHGKPIQVSTIYKLFSE